MMAAHFEPPAIGGRGGGQYNRAGLSGRWHVHRLARTSAVAIAIVFTAAASQAQWSTVGAMQPARRSAASLTFRDARSIVSVTAESADIIRVRFSPTRDFG